MDRRTLLGEHLLACRRRGLSEGTLEKRRYLVSAWLRWLEIEGADVFDVKPDHVERFLDASKLAPASRASSTSHVHMFYKWARGQELTAVDPTEGVERPRQRLGLPRPIHDFDLQLALLFAEDRGDTRMTAGLLLGAVSGLRCCELARLRWDDIQGASARVMGKGSKERVVPLTGATLEALDRVSRTSAFVLDKWQSANPANPGRCASRRFTRHFRLAGVSGSAHRLRHRAATEALMKCHDLRQVQTLLGHASPATTAIYTSVDPSGLKGILVDVNQLPSDQGMSRNAHFAQRRPVRIRRRP